MYVIDLFRYYRKTKQKYNLRKKSRNVPIVTKKEKENIKNFESKKNVKLDHKVTFEMPNVKFRTSEQHRTLIFSLLR